MARNQPHGLMTHGSQRYEESDVDGIFATSSEDFRRVDLNRSTLAVLGWNAVKFLR
jgi:hypothetical protein